MNPCEVGFYCPYCVSNLYGELWCTYSKTILATKYGCPLVEESSELYEWLQVMDDPTVQLAIEKANKVRNAEIKELHNRIIHNKRRRIEEQEKKVDRDDPF